MSRTRLSLIGQSIIDPLTNINLLVNKAEKVFQTEITNGNNTYVETENLNPHHRKSKSFNNRLYSSVPKEVGKINILKKIKSIKHMINNNYDINNPLSMYQSNIAYDKNNIDIIFEPRKQILNYKKRKVNLLNDNENSVSKFVNENKMISFDNYMIKLLRNESQRLKNIENENDKKIEEKELNNKKNNENFNQLIEKQNNALEKIEKALYDLHIEIYKFEEEARLRKTIEKSIDEEMKKILKSLEELRTYGKFVSKVIKIDEGKFDKQIISKDINNQNLFNNSNANPFDYRNLTSKAIDNYKFTLERNEEEEKEINNLLNDPNTMIMKFNEIEDRILRILNERIQDEKSERNINKEMNNMMKETYSRYNFLQNEFNLLTNLYNREIKYLPIIKKKTRFEETKFANEFIQDIYYDMCYSEQNNFKKNKLMKITEIIHDCIQRINIKEDKINKHIKMLEIMEYENPKLFLEVVMNRKLKNKEEKLLEQKKIIDQIEENKKLKSESRFKRIVIKSRKTEAPFRGFNKDFKDESIKIPKIKSPTNNYHNHNDDYEMIIY